MSMPALRLSTEPATIAPAVTGRAGISPDTIRAIVCSGRARGLSVDDLRAMTTTGSLRALSAREGYELLNRLNSGTRYDKPAPARRRRPAGVVGMATDEQRAKIGALRKELGWSEAGLERHLAARSFPGDPDRPMNRIESAADAVGVIEHLKKVQRRVAMYARRRNQVAQEEPAPF